MADPDLRPTADGFATLFSARHGQTYHSRHEASVEVRRVFLDGADVTARLDAGEPTQVLEVGFGTGLNFLRTAQHALATGAPLTFISLERNVLPADTLRALNYAEHIDQSLVDPLIDWRGRLPDAVPPGRFRASVGTASLTLIVGHATDAALPKGCDAVYLDAFSPDAGPELWTPAFCRRLRGAPQARRPARDVLGATQCAGLARRSKLRGPQTTGAAGEAGVPRRPALTA